jgi:hypothetical protein
MTLPVSFRLTTKLKLIVYITCFLYLFYMPLEVIAQTQDAQDVWINDLHLCENSGNVPRIVDSNGYYSYGYLMFQRATFNSYGKFYNLPHDDISSSTEQIAIAKAMLDDGLFHNWYTCSRITKRKYGAYRGADTS